MNPAFRIAKLLMKMPAGRYLLCAVAFLLAEMLHAEAPTVFVGATLIDGSGRLPTEDATLVIQEGRIVVAGKADAEAYVKQHGAQMIDCRGKTIMPALISNHCHLGVVKNGRISPDNYTLENIEAALKQYEAYGVTAVVSRSTWCI
jgi:imidazolonepropionase-like amidohydrolase